ncbi:MAG: NAD(P)-dependent oxidoreductase [Deltaproteobacteria bacterium]|nr:NAD(P)-dependent oxidoreductase [Deltaproteobacteria bacterium]MBW2342156.1 NAD(P)-dependent oxidoreductase [Deltaproteobacteria bacterium]
MAKKQVLITGAAGNIGAKLGNAFVGKYDLIPLDRKKIDVPKAICADLSAYDKNWARYFENLSAVIHLAANPYEGAPWKALIGDNIDSVLNVCHACVKKKVNCLIFASSCHTMGGYKDKNVDLITTDIDPLPDCDYGVSKLIGERICESFSDKYPLSVICLRIGWVPRGDRRPGIDTSAWLRSLWLSNRDLVQVFEKSIEEKNMKFKILYAMSNNKGMNWDLETTMKTLSYKPRD